MDKFQAKGKSILQSAKTNYNQVNYEAKYEINKLKNNMNDKMDEIKDKLKDNVNEKIEEIKENQRIREEQKK